MICPKCSKGEVVVKTHNLVKFAACSRFPKCYFTSNITGKDANGELILGEENIHQYIEEPPETESTLDGEECEVKDLKYLHKTKRIYDR
jgi:ssDNA-binding Zn-finger/Zn-ribbon topoisomerase 1